MGLFDKKFCDICGNKIGLLGNRKLDDGNMCKDCAALLSPWLTGRKSMTVDGIKAHLEYREQNCNARGSFRESRVLGSNWQVHIDDSQGLLYFTKGGRKAEDNPDILRFDQVTGCTVQVEEVRHVESAPSNGPGPGGPGQPGMGGHPGQPGMGGHPGQPGMGGRPGQPGMGGRPGQPGMGGGPGQPGMGGHPGQPGMGGRPGQPGMGGFGSQPAPGGQRVYFTYDFNVTVNVNSEWFNQIKFQVNPTSVDANSPQYNSYNYEAEEIRQALTALTAYNVGNIAAANAPKMAVTCPCCGATTMPDANGCCEFCGGALYN